MFKYINIYMIYVIFPMYKKIKVKKLNKGGKDDGNKNYFL